MSLDRRVYLYGVIRRALEAAGARAEEARDCLLANALVLGTFEDVEASLRRLHADMQSGAAEELGPGGW